MQSTYFFELALMRLKHQLGAEEDQHVADLLGLSKAAFSARKARSSFPEKELRALAQQRPDLGLDVDYVLTGVTEAESLRQRAALHEAAGWPALESRPPPLTADERELLALYRTASLTDKMKAVQALQGQPQGAPLAPTVTQLGRANVTQHIAAPVSGSVAGRDVYPHSPAKKSTKR